MTRMNGVTITDSEGGGLSFDLREVLAAIGSRVCASSWKAEGVECTGEMAADLHSASDGHEWISGDRFVSLSKGVRQVIDGVFKGYSTRDGDPWIVVCAVDSNAFDVWSDDQCVLSRVREAFGEVKDIESDAEFS